MKKISYNLFPIPVLILGYILLFVSISSMILNPASGEIGFRTDQIAPSATLFIIGMVIVSFRSRIIIPEIPGYVIKETVLLGISFSEEKVIIPGRCTNMLICGKTKKGTGYYRFVLPVSYVFKSYDLVFCGEKGMVKFMNTDYSRAVKIAEFLKANLRMKYSFEPEVN